MQRSNLNFLSKSRARVAAIYLKVPRPFHLVRLTLAFIMLAVFGSVFSGSANAQDCGKVITPDATLNLGPGVTDVQSASNGGTYGTGPKKPNSINCHYWVVDIAVPNNSSAAGQYYSRAVNFASGGDIPKTKAECQSFHSHSLVYLKTSEPIGFQLIQDHDSKGVWRTGNKLIPASCSFGEATVPRPPPDSGSVTYRVAGKVTRSGKARMPFTYQVVRIRGWHMSQPG